MQLVSYPVTFVNDPMTLFCIFIVCSKRTFMKKVEVPSYTCIELIVEKGNHIRIIVAIVNENYSSFT